MKNPPRIVFHDPRLASITGGGEVLTLRKIGALERERFHRVIVTRSGRQSRLFTEFRKANPDVEVHGVAAPRQHLPKRVDSFLEACRLRTLWGQDELVDDALRFNSEAAAIYRNLSADLISVSVLTDLAGLPQRIPRVLHIYGCPPPEMAEAEATLVENMGLLSAISPFIWNAFCQTMHQSKRLPECMILPPSVGRPFLETPSSKTKRDITFLYAGRLTTRKGVLPMIKAYAKFRSRWHGGTTKLVVAGAGPMRRQMGNLARQLNLADGVEFPGPLSTEELIERMDRSTFFLYPVLKPESFGLAPLEAMSRGSIPILGVLGGMAQYAENQRNSLVVKEIDEERLAAMMVRALALPEETLVKMRIHAHKTALNPT